MNPLRKRTYVRGEQLSIHDFVLPASCYMDITGKKHVLYLWLLPSW